jgi:hypothetical protein
MATIAQLKAKNPHRLSLAETAQAGDYTSVYDMLERASTDSVVPACCDEYCETEPDGHCEHGCPSVLLAAGLI